MTRRVFAESVFLLSQLLLRQTDSLLICGVSFAESVFAESDIAESDKVRYC